MISYVVAGIALGAIYAVASSALVITYASAGILNFAFGAMAFAAARCYYALNTELGWPILPAALVALGIGGPGLGVLLWALLFRFLAGRPPAVSIVATIGLSVALPPLANLAFGARSVAAAPGLAPQPVAVLSVFGVAVNFDQLITYACVLVVLVVGTVVLRVSDMGLRVRAMVDSPALTTLSGSDPARITVGVWAFSGGLAGLAGVLLAPTAGLTVGGMTGLMAAAFAAVVAARLTQLPVAVLVSVAMGVTTAVAQWLLPTGGALAAAVVPAIPFLFMLAFLILHVARGRSGGTDGGRAGGTLDRAVAPAVRTSEVERGTPGSNRRPLPIGALIGVGALLALPLIVSGYWAGLLALGLAYALALLSYTFVTGEGGMIWLCQITFAGGGAIVAAALATHAGFSPLPAVLVGALAMVPIGLAIGLLTIRLGGIYVALVTLTFGLLVETLVYPLSEISQFGQGITLDRPIFAADQASLSYLVIGFLLLVVLFLFNLRRSTTGLALVAVRWSEPGARTMGISIVAMKLLVSGLATFVAALGGGFIAMVTGAAAPETFLTFNGLVWFAVLVSFGSRSIGAAVLGGLLFVLLPAAFTMLPTAYAEVPALLFGLGAILVARHPEGALAVNAALVRSLLDRWQKPDPPSVADPGDVDDLDRQPIR